jgi:hypothetical protein
LAIPSVSITGYYQTDGTSNNPIRFIAVGIDQSSNNRTFTSTDGIKWTDRAVFDVQLTGIAYGGAGSNAGTWIVVGSDNYDGIPIWYSQDGQSWTAASSATGLDISNQQSTTHSVAYGNGLWVMGGYNVSSTYSLFYSTDNGQNWTNAATDPFENGVICGVAYGNGLWVAVGSDNVSSNTVVYSSDGSNWSNASNSPFLGGSGYSVAYDPVGNVWVAGGQASGITLAYSTDGMTWTQTNNNPFAGVGGVVYGVAHYSGLWVATGSNGTVQTAYSSDGSNWTTSTTQPFSNGIGISVAGDGGSIMIAGGVASTYSGIWNSVDGGSNWTEAPNVGNSMGPGSVIISIAAARYLP